MNAMKATDKYCPLAMGTLVAGVLGTNLDVSKAGMIKDRCMCQSSNCMMWRYTEDSKTDGYCGLAGKPNG